MIIRYDSVLALRTAAIAMKAKAGYFGFDKWGMDSSWYGGETEAETLRYSEIGNTSLVPLAEQLLDKLDQNIETSRRVWEPAPAGAYCCVPDVLAGRPTSMRRMIAQPDERAPISIIAITSSSGGISADILTKRGVAILALVLALTRNRAVSLSVMDIGDGVDRAKETLVLAKINTTPLDLATACYALTSPGFTRRLVYTICHNANGSHGGWPPGYYGGSAEGGERKYLRSLYPKLGLDPAHSLIIDAATLHDSMLTDPLGWIQKQINFFTNAQQEELA